MLLTLGTSNINFSSLKRDKLCIFNIINDEICKIKRLIIITLIEIKWWIWKYICKIYHISNDLSTYQFLFEGSKIDPKLTHYLTNL